MEGQLTSDILLAAAAVTQLVMALIVIARGSRNTSYVAFSLMLLAVSGWVTSNILIDRSPTPELAAVFAQVSSMVNSFLPAFFLYFVVSFPESKLRKSLLLIFIPSFFFFGASFTDWIVTGADISIFPVTIAHGPLFVPLAMYIAAYFLIGLILLIRKLRSSGGTTKLQLQYILIGGYSMIVIALFTNLLLPLLSVDSATRIGPVSSVFFALFTTLAIVRHRLFDIQIRLQSIFNTGFPVVLALLVSSLVAYYMPDDAYAAQAYVAGPVLMLIGIFVYEATKRFVRETSLGHFFFRKTYSYQLALKQLAKNASTILEIDALAQEILTVLVDKMRIERVAILMRSEAHGNRFEVLAQENYASEHLEALLHLEEGTKSAFFEHTHKSYSCADVDHMMKVKNVFPKDMRQLTEIKKMCDSVQANLILPLRFQQSLMGFILLGDKFPQKPYTEEDIFLLENVSNELAAALANSKLHQDRVMLTKMLREEVDRATAKWKQKAKENEELFNVKSQFITVASHQMRTPISVLRNTMQMLLEDYLTAEEGEDKEALKGKLDASAGLVRNSYLAGENLRHTSEMILAASEFVGGGAGVNVKDIQTKAFFEKRERYTRDLLQAETKKNVELITEIADDLPEVLRQDNEKLAMIVDILLSNAVLYTNTGTITFTADVDENNLTISVSDTGIGIPEADQDKLFQQFIRLPNAKKVVPDGTGLGLYLAKEYSQLLGGDITFESQAGVGTTFTVHIPLKYQYA